MNPQENRIVLIQALTFIIAIAAIMRLLIYLTTN